MRHCSLRKRVHEIDSKILARALSNSDALERRGWMPGMPPLRIDVVISKALEGRALNPVEREVLDNEYSAAMYIDLRLGDVFK